ncbi:hypothetical protein AAFF_G00162160 [Aldrovandia affinis]|uniref:Uncharacterized protein n=1 Tax=Aldrovandia affinis TaxID=143900 RepID=A0AAD7RMR8_9TELE|nr:hypothetical protein AAFF_G00162160 [Aldrovandia affinis]
MAEKGEHGNHRNDPKGLTPYCLPPSLDYCLQNIENNPPTVDWLQLGWVAGGGVLAPPPSVMALQGFHQVKQVALTSRNVTTTMPCSACAVWVCNLRAVNYSGPWGNRGSRRSGANRAALPRLPGQEARLVESSCRASPQPMSSPLAARRERPVTKNAVVLRNKIGEGFQRRL